VLLLHNARAAAGSRCLLTIIMLLAASPHGRGAAAPTINDAQTLFYSAQYHDAAEAAQALLPDGRTDLRAAELRSSALLFQLRRAVDNAKDKDKALKECGNCAALMTAFRLNTTLGVDEARLRLKANPLDDEALYFLGKLDLNHVWLYLGTIGKKTGWDEYWEARHSLDDLLARSPRHTRGRVARAWIDYIVDTEMPFGTKWLLGGGNKKRGLAVVKDAASTADDFFVRAEARFALLDMQKREKNVTGAVATARELTVDFPQNSELREFIAKNVTPSKP
jgi:hypothetical protein